MEERLINIKRGIQLIFALCEKEEYFWKSKTP
jgi:hypothetical protein